MIRTTTPLSETLIKLLGGTSVDGVTLSSDERKEILRIYKIESEENVMMAAGAQRNAYRAATSDGLRIMAWIAKYLEKDEDPLRFIVQLVDKAGFDVDYEDIEWSHFIDVEDKAS